MPDWLSHEPVAWTLLADAVIFALVQWGVPITDDEKKAVDLLILALSGVFIRQKVLPTAKIIDDLSLITFKKKDARL